MDRMFGQDDLANRKNNGAHTGFKPVHLMPPQKQNQRSSSDSDNADPTARTESTNADTNRKRKATQQLRSEPEYWDPSLRKQQTAATVTGK